MSKEQFPFEAADPSDPEGLSENYYPEEERLPLGAFILNLAGASIVGMNMLNQATVDGPSVLYGPGCISLAAGLVWSAMHMAKQARRDEQMPSPIEDLE